jgi:dienelactone hydrolase
MSTKDQKKIRKSIKKGEELNLFTEHKQLKRQKIILSKAEELSVQGFKNIILAGWSAGAWASLNLQSRFPKKFKGSIAFNPGFAGPKKEWEKKYPEWGAFRKHQVNIFKQTDYLNAIIFAHSNDNFEDPETLSFFKEFKGMQFIDYSEINPATCNWADVDKKMPSNKGHYIPQSSCVTKYINDNNYLINYLEKIF